MKQAILTGLSALLLNFTLAQNCNSLRYRDTIFHQVTVSTVKFGTATPYGLLAQPQDLFLDFYEPTGDTLSKRPLIVFQFGGGFTIGWRSEPVIPQFCDYFAKCGYAVASIDYRIGLNALDTNSTVRAYYRGVQDERSAIRYLCQRAAQYKFDTSLIILTGTSAGCFCAFANAFTTNADRPASTFGSLLEPDNMGCMDCSGNTDFDSHIPRIKAIVNQWGAVMDTTVIASNEQIPVITFHGDQDILVPYVYGYPFQLPVFPKVFGAIPIHQRLNSMGIKNELHTLVGYGHEPELLAPTLNDTIYHYARQFLFDILQPNTSPISGDSAVCSGTVSHYTVTNSTGSTYCWNITSHGTIIANSGHSIAVLWNDTGTTSITVKEVNTLLAEGNLQTFIVQVVPQAVSSFSYSTNELDVSVSNLSANADTFLWNYGDGDFSNLANPQPTTYSSGGTYEISLVASNAFCADTTTQIIVIDSCPVAEITYQLNGHNAFFYSPPTNTTSYFWNFGDGDSAAVSASNVFHQYNFNNNYTVLLSVRNQLGCTVTDTVSIQITSATDINQLQNQFNITFNNELLIVKTEEREPLTLEILNLAGKKIWESKVYGYTEIPITGLATAVYFLRLTNKQQTYVQRFCKY